MKTTDMSVGPEVPCGTLRRRQTNVYTLLQARYGGSGALKIQVPSPGPMSFALVVGPEAEKRIGGICLTRPSLTSPGNPIYWPLWARSIGDGKVRFLVPGAKVPNRPDGCLVFETKMPELIEALTLNVKAPEAETDGVGDPLPEPEIIHHVPLPDDYTVHENMTAGCGEKVPKGFNPFLYPPTHVFDSLVIGSTKPLQWALCAKCVKAYQS